MYSLCRILPVFTLCIISVYLEGSPALYKTRPCRVIREGNGIVSSVSRSTPKQQTTALPSIWRRISLALYILNICNMTNLRPAGWWHSLINNITRWTMWIVFVIKLHFLLPCFGLSALYLPAITPALYTKQVLMVIVGSILSKDPLTTPPPLFLSRYVIYLWWH